MNLLNLSKFVVLSVSGATISIPIVLLPKTPLINSSVLSKHNCYSISTKVNSDGKLLVCSNNKYYLYKNSLEELTDVKINNNKILAKLANQTQTQEEDKTFSWEIENQEWEPSSQDISLALSSIKPIEGSGLPKEENYCFLVYELNDNRDAKIFCSWSSTKDAGFIKLIPF